MYNNLYGDSSAQSSDDCKSNCCSDSTCQVWQWSDDPLTPPNCWTGDSDDYGDSGGVEWQGEQGKGGPAPAPAPGPAPPVRPGLLPSGEKSVGKRCDPGEADDCISIAECKVYISGHTYDLSALHSNTGFEAKDPNSPYDYWINFCRPIADPPSAACKSAEGDCAGDPLGCSALQVTRDGSSCYACGNVGSVTGTFYDPASGTARPPQDGLTMLMSSGTSPDPTSNRWLVVRLICGMAEPPGQVRELVPPGGVSKPVAPLLN
jgi:hypothetical protein